MVTMTMDTVSVPSRDLSQSQRDLSGTSHNRSVGVSLQVVSRPVLLVNQNYCAPTSELQDIYVYVFL